MRLQTTRLQRLTGWGLLIATVIVARYAGGFAAAADAMVGDPSLSDYLPLVALKAQAFCIALGVLLAVDITWLQAMWRGRVRPSSGTA